jgi:hypothetical protein
MAGHGAVSQEIGYADQVRKKKAEKRRRKRREGRGLGKYANSPRSNAMKGTGHG